jgi:hypothetical protein
MTRLLIIALLAACGSKESTTPVGKAGSAAEAHSETGEHEMAMPPELEAFHDVLAPRWHAEKGQKRMDDTCAAVPDFQKDADAIAKATPPRSANADAWTNGTKQLVAAVAGLDTACKGKDLAAFETAFEKVHESFHVLLEAAGEEHK